MTQQESNSQATEQGILSVLFVDDETHILDGLRRQFRAKRTQWDMRFADSGQAALDMLEEKPADVVISDMRMPGMSGAELLKQVQYRWPQTVRFVLSGQTDESELLGHVGYIHQYMQKPCDPHVLDNAISRALELTRMVESPELRRLVTGIRSLPIISETFDQLLKALDSEDSDAEEIAEIASQDIGLSAKLLQMVNSAFFGMPRDVYTVKDAVVLIGTANLKAMVMAAQIFDGLLDSPETSHVVSNIWSASHEIAKECKEAARAHGLQQEECELISLSGMLSHIGRAIIARSMPYQYGQAEQLALAEGISMDQAEHDVLDIHQEKVGAYALGLWGFSDTIIESVAYQTTPRQSQHANLHHPLVWLHRTRGSFEKTGSISQCELDEAWVEEIMSGSQEERGAA